mgnify:CR=1 FL=1
MNYEFEIIDASNVFGESLLEGLNSVSSLTPVYNNDTPFRNLFETNNSSTISTCCTCIKMLVIGILIFLIFKILMKKNNCEYFTNKPNNDNINEYFTNKPNNDNINEYFTDKPNNDNNDINYLLSKNNQNSNNNTCYLFTNNALKSSLF